MLGVNGPLPPATGRSFYRSRIHERKRDSFVQRKAAGRRQPVRIEIPFTALVNAVYEGHQIAAHRATGAQRREWTMDGVTLTQQQREHLGHATDAG